MAWAWRDSGKGSIRRSVSLCLWSSLHILAFAAAGILSSQVTSARSEVLLQDVQCRTYPANLKGLLSYVGEDFEDSVAASTDAHINVALSSNFAASCYENSSGTTQGCLPYGRRKMYWTRNLNSECPFASSMCKEGLAISFDSGYLDSHLDLGINAKPGDRIKFRKNLTCAPVPTEGFCSGLLDTSQAGDPTALSVSSNSNQRFVIYYYGPNPAQNVSSTFIWSNYSTTGVTNSVQLTPYFLRLV